MSGEILYVELMRMSIIGNHNFAAVMPSPSQMNGSVDARMIAAIRCILAFSGLVIVYIDPTRPSIFSTLTYSSLVIYGVWSCILAIMAFRRDISAPPPRDTYWGDMLFCAYLVTLTQGTNSLFFTFFLFAILSASFSRGTKEGLLVTAASVVLFVLASLWFEPDAKFGFDQSLVRPIYLLTLGYMISYWGGDEITQRRRIKLLQDVSGQLNQRLGYDHAITVNLERILNFFEAKACILILENGGNPPVYCSYYISHRRPQQGELPEPMGGIADSNNAHKINDEGAKVLLDLPPSFSISYHQTSAWWRRNFDKFLNVRDSNLNNELGAIANLLGAESFLTVPYSQQDGIKGRLYLVPDGQAFKKSEVAFVSQLLASISRVVENIRLMDEIISASAKHERFTISLDIHDTTIQPYIGLKLGLDALNRQAGINNPLGKEISELLAMTEATIKDLRGYVSTLREGQVLTKDSLLVSIQEQAEHFKRFYGIDIKVTCDSGLRLNSRIAYAVLQIFSEGLSNILRHTQSKRAFMKVYSEGPHLQLEIGNEISGEESPQADFIPRSINARALSLGGACFVRNDSKTDTIVCVSIPL